MTSLTYGLNLKKGGVISLVGAGGKTALMFRMARELSKSGDPVLTTTTTKIYMPARRQSAAVIISECAETLVDRAAAVLRQNPHISAGSKIVHFQHKLKGLKPETIDDLWNSGVFRWIIVEADGAAGRPVKAPAAHEPVIPQCTKWLIGLVGLSAVGKPLTESWAFRSQLFAKISGLAIGAAITEKAIAAVLVDKNGILKNCPRRAKRFVFLNQADSPNRLIVGRKITRYLAKHAELGFERVLIGQTLYEPSVAAYVDLKR